MRILMIHNSPLFPGGEDTYLKSLITLLRAKKHKVVCCIQNSKSIKNLHDKITASLRMFWNNKINYELYKIIKKFRPDVVHFHNIFPLITPSTYWVCKKLNVPIIQRMASFRFICPKATLFRDKKICELCVKKFFFIHQLSMVAIKIHELVP